MYVSYAGQFTALENWDLFMRLLRDMGIKITFLQTNGKQLKQYKNELSVEDIKDILLKKKRNHRVGLIKQEVG